MLPFCRFYSRCFPRSTDRRLKCVCEREKDKYIHIERRRDLLPWHVLTRALSRHTSNRIEMPQVEYRKRWHGHNGERVRLPGWKLGNDWHWRLRRSSSWLIYGSGRVVFNLHAMLPCVDRGKYLIAWLRAIVTSKGPRGCRSFLGLHWREPRSSSGIHSAEFSVVVDLSAGWRMKYPGFSSIFPSIVLFM